MEEKIKQTNPTLHRYLFTVTTFSKLLAMFLFIVLPIIGFYLGMKYQELKNPGLSDLSTQGTQNDNVILNPTSIPNQINKTDVLKYGIACNTGEKIGYVTVTKINNYIFYVTNKNGDNQKQIGTYIPGEKELGFNGVSGVKIIGFNCDTNELYFVKETGLPAAIKGSFSILNIDDGTIKNNTVFPNGDFQEGFVFSPDYKKIYTSDFSHIYEYNLDKNEVLTIFTIPKADLDSFNTTEPGGETNFLIKPDYKITSDNKLIFYYNYNFKPNVKFSLDLITHAVGTLSR